MRREKEVEGERGRGEGERGEREGKSGGERYGYPPIGDVIDVFSHECLEVKPQL